MVTFKYTNAITEKDKEQNQEDLGGEVVWDFLSPI